MTHATRDLNFLTPTGSHVDTVLIVDDHPDNLMVLGELLSGDYHVRAANSGEKALRLVDMAPVPDLILLDVMMPQMSGHEVIRQLRAQPKTRDIPVIFITAMTAAEDETLGLELGAVDYILKPFNPSVVLARVKTHVELKRVRDKLLKAKEWLEQEVERRTHENRLIQDLSIAALANLAETRDNETGHHIVRTQLYVEVLAKDLQCHPRFDQALEGRNLAMMVKAAPLHDVGKVGIPDAILLKPGRLTEEEMVIMKTHASIGAQALTRAMEQAVSAVDQEKFTLTSDAFTFLRMAKEISLGHHEKWDGSGYPSGLAGDAIPVSARLMALADVFDALISRRVYKPPMSIEASAEIIRHGRGTHFDPDVVDAFDRCLPLFRDIVARSADPDTLPL